MSPKQIETTSSNCIFVVAKITFLLNSMCPHIYVWATSLFEKLQSRLKLEANLQNSVLNNNTFSNLRYLK